MDDHAAHGAGLLDAVAGAAGSAPAVTVGLLAFGIVTGLTHCSGMCGPFVLTRAIEASAGRPATTIGPWGRLGIGALPAYHLGRALTYSVLGGIAGAVGGGFASVVRADAVRYAFIGLAVALVVAPAFKTHFPGRKEASRAAEADEIRSQRRLSAPWSSAVARVARSAARSPGFGRELMLGMAMGFLPCGMIYAALAAAAGSGSTLAGATGMAAFAAGTWPALALVGALGAVAGRRWRVRLQRWSVPLAAASLLAMGVWAAHAA